MKLFAFLTFISVAIFLSLGSHIFAKVNPTSGIMEISAEADFPAYSNDLYEVDDSEPGHLNCHAGGFFGGSCEVTCTDADGHGCKCASWFFSCTCECFLIDDDGHSTN